MVTDDCGNGALDVSELVSAKVRGWTWKLHAGETVVFCRKVQKTRNFGYNIGFWKFWRVFMMTSA